ncbi:MAG: four helix bundle protein [Chitinophagaceae bacterium]
MATITKFEELEIWQLARAQTKEFNELVTTTGLAKDFELRNQMNASSGSVMDNIAEGFERSGTNEFKNFLIIAKGSNGEYRSQLYRCFDRNYITQEKLDDLLIKNLLLSNKLMAFVNYLRNTSLKGHSRKDRDISN